MVLYKKRTISIKYFLKEIHSSPFYSRLFLFCFEMTDLKKVENNKIVCSLRVFT